MARYGSDSELEEWLVKSNLTNRSSLKYLGIHIQFNNKWGQHIGEKMKKMKRAYYKIKEEGVAVNQIDTISNINLMKSLVISTGTYGSELMTLGINEIKMFNKEMAKFYKEILGIDRNAPTEWVLWEVNQEGIKEKIMKSKLNYWKQKMKTGRNGIHYDIVMWKGSMFNKQNEEIKSELGLGRGWDFVSIGKWKDIFQRGVDKKR